MGESETTRRKRHIDRIIEQVASWPNLETNPRRFGGTEFNLGPREIGHVHQYGVVDIAFPKQFRDVLVEQGRIEPHPIYPESGWTTFRFAAQTEIENAVWLLRLSYLVQALMLARSEPALLDNLDVGEQIDELDLSDDLKDLVEDVRPD